MDSPRMKRYFDVVPKFKETQSIGSNSGVNSNDSPLMNEDLNQVIAESEANLAYNLPGQHVDFESLEADPGLRKKFTDFHPNVPDEVRRSYIQKGPFQPRDHDFPTCIITSMIVYMRLSICLWQSLRAGLMWHCGKH
ncbi:unnamed protein product [Cuscuta epithymum]|uniref:Uncharacterized protein n=1 Tax=Cuscuta epithymum TaxID=186058 RepID=A0AAV0GH37_9ASTE|nr:unnamed protein product [Cuscuta epithymum]